MNLVPNLWPAARVGHRWLHRMTRREATVDGHRMVWLERGRPGPGRPTVLLIHGFSAMKETWSLWMTALPRHWHIIAVDLPGFGESDYRDGAQYGYRTQALRLRDWLKTHAVEDVHIVGHSMGAAIAAILAHWMEPGALTLTLMSSAGFPDRPDADLSLPLEATPEDTLIPSDWPGVYRMFNQVGNGKPTITGLAMTALLGSDVLGRTQGHRQIFSDMISDPWAVSQTVKHTKIPIQVQWGDRDRITPVRCLEYIKANLPEAEICLYQGVGHTPMLERPGATARDLQRFIERHTRKETEKP